MDQGYNNSKQINEVSVLDIKKSNIKFFKRMWIVLVVVLSALMIRFVIAGISDILAIDRPNETVIIEIPKGSGFKGTVKVLKENGVIKYENFFKMYSILRGSSRNFISGSFEIKTNLDYEAIINYIQSNSNRLDKDLTKVTITEGLSVLECAKLLDENNVCDKDEFIAACNSNGFDEDFKFIADLGESKNRCYKLEGYLFPDTYEFYKDQKASRVISRILGVCEDKLFTKRNVSGFDKKVDVNERAQSIGMTLNEVMTLASIVQSEAANNEDMYNVSSVLHNRLKTESNGGVSQYGDAGMTLLSMDSTTWYPYRTKSSVPSDILKNFDGKYDTYKYTGLPIGPICSPGMEAINAVLNPNKTNYYFFCHDADGNAYYAKTFSEHSGNLKKAGLL